MNRWVKRGLLFVVGIVVLLVLSVVFIWEKFPSHQHCIKEAGLTFLLYTEAHNGRLPSSTNGFGDALLLLAKSQGDGDLEYANAIISVVVGVGDTGEVFRKALASGGHVPETNCSRIYVQELTKDSDSRIAMLFDAYPTHGGDHFRRPWGPLVREVCLLDGSMQIIHEDRWPQYSKEQIELLVTAGIPRARAEYYYRLATVKHSTY